MTVHLLRPCKSTAAFEAIPHEKLGYLNLNLNRIKNQLMDKGFELVCDAKVMLIFKKEIEVSIYPSGKLILKTDSRIDAEKIMNEIYSEFI